MSILSAKGVRNAMAASALLAICLAPTRFVHAQQGAAGAAISGDITFWHTYNTVGPENIQLITKVLPAFEKLYPNVVVHSQDVPYTSMLQKLVASVAAGNGPDVIRSDIIWMPQLAKIGALSPVDDMLANHKRDFYTGPLATCAYNGHYYGLPLDTNTKVIIYNKTLFARAGIAHPPTTTAEFATDAVKIAKLGKGIYGYDLGGIDPWVQIPWIASFGGNVTNPSVTTASGFINGSSSVAAVQYLQQLQDDGALAPTLLNASTLSGEDMIGRGMAGMTDDGPWSHDILTKQYPKAQWGYAPFPAGPNGHSASVIGGEDIAAMKSTQNMPAVRAFMTFMTSRQAQVLMGQVDQMPTLINASTDSSLPSYLSVFNQQLRTAVPRTVSPNYTKIETIFNDSMNLIFRHKTTTQKALDTAAAQITPLLH